MIFVFLLLFVRFSLEKKDKEEKKRKTKRRKEAQEKHEGGREAGRSRFLSCESVKHTIDGYSYTTLSEKVSESIVAKPALVVSIRFIYIDFRWSVRSANYQTAHLVVALFALGYKTLSVCLPASLPCPTRYLPAQPEMQPVKQ